MRAFRAKTILLAAAGILLASPAVAAGLDPSQFDLLCQGTMTSQSMNVPSRDEKSTSSPFTTRVQVDLQMKAFCIDAFCDRFTLAEPRHLGYRCDVANRTTFCGEVGGSTAGPFPQRQAFSVDRSTGSFQRTVSGSEGDIVAFPFSESYSGHCTPAPFTKFSKLQQIRLSNIAHGLSQ